MLYGTHVMFLGVYQVSLVNIMIVLRDDFHIGLIIGPRTAVLAEAQPKVNITDRGPITRPI